MTFSLLSNPTQEPPMSPSDSIRSSRGLRLPLSVLAALALAVPGCATEASHDGPTGTLVLPLVQAGADGEVFRLTNAVFDITGGDGTFSETVTSTVDPELDVTMPPGIAQVLLHDGWTLERSTDGGVTFAPVSALLASFNPGVARVLANAPSSLEFAFVVRDTTGTLQIKLSVITQPRELAGGYIVDTATGDLAAYAEFSNRRLDFAVFYDLFSLQSEVLPDGTKQHVYTADHVAMEWYNDQLGTLANQIGPDMPGSFLTYTVAARPDGTFEVSGELAGGFNHFTDILFGPSTIDAITSPTLDSDGFPKDEFFYDSELPFTQTTDASTITGTLRMRHLIPGQPGPRQ
jgi:hypothetical protein